MKPFAITLLFLIFFTSHLQPVTRTVSNPQTQMVSARTTSLGVTNPVISGDISAMYANPASLGDIESMPLSATNKTILNDFKYQLVNVGLPLDLRIPLRNDKTMLQRIMFGFSYGDVGLSGIPETTLDSNDIPRQIGSFNSGYRVLGLGAGTAFYDVFGFDTLALGSALKLTQFYTLGTQASTYSIDAGGIGTRFVDYGPVDKLSVGVSIQNIIAPSLIDEETGNEGLLPFEFYGGLRADLFDETLALYAHNGFDGFTIGTEYLLQSNIFIRGSTDTTRINLGTGILFEKVATGFGNRDYSLRFDYNYTQNRAPFDGDPNHAFSISILGESRPRAPRILEPTEEFIVSQEQLVTLAGVGPKNTTMQIFNNHALSRSVVSDKFGKWRIRNFPLKEGRNLVYLRSYTLDKDTSLQSYPIVIYSDTKAPDIDVEIYPEDDMLIVQLFSDENITELDGSILSTVLQFKRLKKDPELTGEVVPKRNPTVLHDEPTQWRAEIPIPREVEGPKVPKELLSLQLMAKDEAGNISDSREIPFFAAIDFPQDKYVHYKESLRFIGNASEMVNSVAINDNAVYIDPENRFAIPINLEAGKNKVRVDVKTLNDKVLSYSLRVLRLETFPDLNERVRGRREIEFLATLGVLTGDDDGNFYPYKPVTRQYVAKLMVLASGGESDSLPEVSSDLFRDVPQNHPFAAYIQAAVEAGLIFAFPDGTFKPDQPLTLSETVFLLSNAGIINFQEVEDGEANYITRNELAEFLAYSPEYELKIENLIDWERGY
jgi:hypothetical protein